MCNIPVLRRLISGIEFGDTLCFGLLESLLYKLCLELSTRRSVRERCRCLGSVQEEQVLQEEVIDDVADGS